MAANQIEKTIQEVITNRHITANQLALCNVFYNTSKDGISLMAAAKIIGKEKPCQIGGITSQLAQRIDSIAPLRKQFGFTGYILFFQRIDGRLMMRPEFRNVIDRYPEFKKAMIININEVYVKFKKGVDL